MTVAGLLGLALPAVEAATVTVASAAPSVKVPITGTVRCVSHSDVVGVLVDAERGGSDYAHIARESPVHSIYTYNYLLPYGGKYLVRVGCGGVPSHWGFVATSALVTGTPYNFVCDDVHTRGLRYGHCGY